MLTGTLLDLTPFGPLLSAFGLLYWVFGAGAAVLAWWWPKSRAAKVILTATVLTLFGYPIFTRTTARDDAQTRLAESMAVFRERCKTAGEDIVRTVDNVDGVVWMKWREIYRRDDLPGDQFLLNDPYGHDCGAEECITNLLRVTAGGSLNSEEAERFRVGYAYVETVDPKDSRSYRYRSVIKPVHTRTPQQIEEFKKNTGRDPGPNVYGQALEREPISTFSSTYGITWADVSTRQDREHWIAGGQLQILDLHTHQVLAERTGYIIDPGQGSTAGFRSPWGWSKAYGPRCPSADASSRDFAVRVLRPQ